MSVIPDKITRIDLGGISNGPGEHTRLGRSGTRLAGRLETYAAEGRWKSDKSGADPGTN